MSWLARSLVNSLKLDDDDHYSENDVASDDPSPSNRNQQEEQDAQSSSETEEEEEAQTRGVKEDLTELKQTLTKQLWGVASFLASPPPPPLPPPPVVFKGRSLSSNLNLNNIQSEPSDRVEDREGEESDSEELSKRIKQDFVEIRGRFRQMASNYFPFGSEEIQIQKSNEYEIENENSEDEGDEYGEELETAAAEEEEEEDEDWDAKAIGITDEVLAFARNIAMHPETWLDFPLDMEDDLDDFDMSSAQLDHAFLIERLAPRLAALRIELCPCHMTESFFWKVYFVLLHSRLNKQDAEILSTPQVMEARAMWMQELHKLTKPEDDWYGRGTNYENDCSNELHEDFGYARTYDFEPTTSSRAHYETEKHPVVSTDVKFIDKSVIEEKPVIKLEDKDVLASKSTKIAVPTYEDEDDDWPEDEDEDLGSYKVSIPIGNEDDFSFSDLEDDTSSTIPIKSKPLSQGTGTSTS